jgi:hypothetical protein
MFGLRNAAAEMVFVVGRDMGDDVGEAVNAGEDCEADEEFAWVMRVFERYSGGV